MKTRARVAVAALCTLIAAAALGTSAALADPAGTPTFRNLAGVGSDTTEEVVQGLSDVVLIDGVKQIASYNATGSAQITTKDPGTTPGCTINRPNGSSAGRDALLASLQANSGAGNGCLDFARSSSSRGTFTSTPSMTWVPFAVEGLSYAVTTTSSVPRKLTKAQLVSIYKCEITGPAGAPFKPVLPQAGSGTRSSWLSYIYGTASPNLALYPCLVDTGAQEHDGRILDDSSLVPFSSAQWIAQASGTIQEKRGRSTLGQIDGTTAIATNTSFANVRTVNNIIPTSKIGTAPWDTVFVGPSSQVCTNVATILQYGLAVSPSCGSTSSQS
ncbi:MAG: substrate-binding domain-containing protein [Mycobacteriales bacterium]|nr:substrate-binding domain-containing protein [Mycobacteriales bacterium]